MSIAAGKLNQRVELQSATYTQDDRGEPIADWDTYATVWAEIEPLQPRQAEVARSYADSITHTITIRYTDDFLPTHRILQGTRVFAINGVINVKEADTELTIFATEVIGGATIWS